MMFFRVLFLGLALACMVCFALFIVTGEPRWRRRGVVILLGSMAAVVLFFAVLIGERVMALQALR